MTSFEHPQLVQCMSCYSFLLASCKSYSRLQSKASALTSSLLQRTCELLTLASLHDGRTASPTNLNRHALVSYIDCASATDLYPCTPETPKLTQPVLNKVFPDSARGAISHNLKERSAFPPAEAISQRRRLELRIRALRSCEPRHAGVGQLLYSDFRRLEKGGRLGPDGFIEREGVGEIAIRATNT